MLAADLLRGDKPFVGVRRWHADVDDRGVGPCKPDVAEELIGVFGLGDHLDAGISQQAHNALPREHDVVGDDYPHGISARRVVAPMSMEPPSAPILSAK